MTDTAKTPVEPSHQNYRARSHFANLDGLRFVCILMVLWHHAQPFNSDTYRLLDRGFLGVDLFFILSGFLITTLLLREAEDYGAFSLRNFYIRRIIRIVPVYFFVVTCVAAYYIGVKGRHELLELLPFYYLFLSNFLVEDIPLLTITWSLSVEEQYYMIWPMLLLLLPARWLVPACLVLIAANVLGVMGLLGGAPFGAGPLLFRLPNATYAPIIMGSLAAILLHRRNSFDIMRPVLGARMASVVIAVLLVGYLHFGVRNLLGLPNLLVHSLMTLLVMSLVMRERTPLSGFLTLPIITRVGMVSYGMYLYHLIALDITRRSLAMVTGTEMDQVNGWVTLPLYFVLTYLIAELSFRTLEAWFRRFRPSRPTVPAGHRMKPASVPPQS